MQAYSDLFIAKGYTWVSMHTDKSVEKLLIDTHLPIINGQHRIKCLELSLCQPNKLVWPSSVEAGRHRDLGLMKGLPLKTGRETQGQWGSRLSLSSQTWGYLDKPNLPKL